MVTSPPPAPFTPVPTAAALAADDRWSQAERRRLERVCAAVTRDPDAAVDLAQETLLTAWRLRDRLAEVDQFRRWHDAIARHVCRRWLSRRARLATHERVGDVGDDHGSLVDPVAALLERTEVVELLERALAHLHPAARAVLRERYVDDLEPREIADAHGWTPEAASMRLSRAHRRLRAVVEDQLSDDPLAQVWLTRHGAGWRPTRLPCIDCGDRAMTIRRDARQARLELRCPACEPDGVSVRVRLDNPVLGPRLGGLQRPTAVVDRLATWTQEYWPAAITSGTATCTRCTAEVAARPYQRTGSDPRDSGRGWQVTCGACGEELNVSLRGLLLTEPETRAVRRRHPRLRTVPDRAGRFDGTEVVLVGVRDAGSAQGVDTVVDPRTWRPLAVVPTDGPPRRWPVPS